MTVGASWSMSPEIHARAETRMDRVGTAIKQGVLAGEILYQSKLKTERFNGDPLHRRSGNLSRATFIEPTSVGGFNGYVGYVGIGKEVPYAYGLEEGNPPHLIRAEEGHYLRFAMNGVTYFRHEVNHPGNRPFKFMAQTATEIADSFFSGIQKRVEKALMDETTT